MAQKIDASFRLGHRPALDGLRGIAILMVLGTHMAYLWSGMTWRLRGGYIGVDIFFVLSGFLITSILAAEFDREGRISLRNFYKRRARRLFPGLWTMLLASFIVWRLLPNYSARANTLGIELRGLGAILAYFNNWADLWWQEPWGVSQTWSLAIEEQFYLVWPVLLIVLLRLKRPRVMGATVLSIIVISTVDCAWVNRYHAWTLVAYLRTDCRLSGLMLGAGAALLLRSGWRPPKWINWVAIVSAVFLLAEENIPATGYGVAQWQLNWGGFTLISLAACVILISVLEPKGFLYRPLSIAPLRYIGKISYSIYLWHYPVIFALTYLLPSPNQALIRILMFYPITAVLSTFSYHLIERRFLKPSVAVKEEIATPGTVPELVS